MYSKTACFLIATFLCTYCDSSEAKLFQNLKQRIARKLDPSSSKTYDLALMSINNIIKDLKSDLYVLDTAYEAEKSGVIISKNTYSISKFIDEFKNKTITIIIDQLEQMDDLTKIDLSDGKNILSLAGKLYYDKNVVDRLFPEHTLNELRKVYSAVKEIEDATDSNIPTQNEMMTKILSNDPEYTSEKVAQTEKMRKANSLNRKECIRKAYSIIVADIKDMLKLADLLRKSINKLERKYSKDAIKAFQEVFKQLAEKVVVYTIQFGDKADWHDYREDIKVTEEDLQGLKDQIHAEQTEARQLQR